MFWLLIGLLLLIFPAPVKAQSEFTTNYQVDYRVSESGLTQVNMEVELINRLSNIYASEFTVSIGSTNLEQINLNVGGADLNPQVVKGNKTTNITVIFPEKVLGKDKSQLFNLSFSSRDFARRLGRVWEVTIPRLAKSDSLDNYQLSLTIPQSFGQSAIISPAPLSQTAAGSATLYRFKPEDLYESGIAATFGREQSFDFSFEYRLNNAYFYPIETEIALPPDTAWQQVIYQTLEPQPVNVQVDPDGNWLASYRLGSQENLTVTATGSARLFLNPRPDYPLLPPPAADYLQPQKYWEADQPRIKEIASDRRQPRQIYQYVVENLIYDYGRLSQTPTRLGAANALDNRDSALCLEFTDLFVALGRAAGIPSRAINGFAYTDNASLRPLSLKQDVLHAWPEYYDANRGLWIPVDPTWGNTTGGVDFFSQRDLNHFTFAILGQSSTYPIPAGGYKNNGAAEKSVFVDFGQSASPKESLDIEFNLPAEVLAGVESRGELIVKNTGNIALYRRKFRLTGQDVNVVPAEWEVDYLPPLAQVSLAFTLPATPWNTRLDTVLTADSDLISRRRPLKIAPAYQMFFSRTSVFLALLSLVFLGGVWSLRTVLKWKR